MPPGLLPSMGLLAQGLLHSSQQADGRALGEERAKGAVVSFRGHKFQSALEGPWLAQDPQRPWPG